MTMLKNILHQLAIFLGLRSAVNYGNGKLAKACLKSALVLELTGSEVEALRLGKRIPTIKSIRLRTGLGLREAVTVVRVIVADNPEYLASAEWSHKCDAYPSGTRPWLK